MRRVTSVTFLVLLCLILPFAVQAANLIVNGDFTSAPSIPGSKVTNAWYVTYGTTPPPIYVGLSYATQSAVFTPQVGCSFNASNAKMTTLRYWTGLNGVTPGRTYTFSFQYKTIGSGYALGGPNTSGDTSTCQLQEIAYQGGSNIVNASTGYGQFPAITVATGNNWTNYSKTFTTEDTVDNIVFKFNVAMGAGNDMAGIGYVQDSFQVDNVTLLAHPLVVITSPTTMSSYETTASTVNISGTASSDSALTSVTWSNSAGGSGTCTGTTSWSKTGIALVNGDNIITVSTTNADGKTGTDTILVTKTIPLPVGPIITDNFGRTAGVAASLGTTDAPNAYPWARGIYNGVIDPRVSIDGDKLQLGTGPNCWSGTFIDGLVMRDFDAKITIQVPGNPGPGLWWGAGWTGIQYRGMKPMYAEYQTGNDTAGDPAAYLLQFSSGTEAGIYGVQIASEQTGVIASAVSGVNLGAAHVVRLKVVGSRHRVWIDNILDTDTPKLDVVNTNNLGVGHFEVCRRDYPTTCDNLQIKLHDEYGTVAGTVRDATTNAVVPGAEVMVFGKTVVTGLDGTYTLPGIVTGTWQMNVSADSYNSFSKNTTITPGATTTENVLLTPVASTITIFDTFTRDDSYDLGTTEDARHCPWIKSDPASSTAIIYGTMNFDEGSSDGVALGGGVFPADFDLAADFTCGSFYSTGYAGFAYRALNKGVEDSGSYSIHIDPDNNILTLHGHGAGLATVTLPWTVDFYANPGPAVEVKATGNRHRVWIDGTKYIDYTDMNPAARNSGGFINVVRSSIYAIADNFNLTAWGSVLGGSITGTVTSSGLPLSGADVSIVGAGSATTDSNGIYTIADVPPGLQTVRASFPGLGSDQYAVTVVADGSVTQNFVLLAVATGTYSDTFTRADDMALGTTEDASQTPWVKSAGADSLIGIVGNAMAFAASGPTYPCAALQGISVKDFEVNFDMAAPGLAMDGWAGLRYRTTAQAPGDNFDGKQFVFHVNASTVYLWHPDLGHLAAIPSSINWSTSHHVKLVVEGTSHKCWIDNSLIYDVSSSVDNAPGFVALARCNDAAVFDNFTLAPIGVATPVSSTAAVKDLGTGKDVELTGAIITGKIDPVFFYVEDANRSGGIKVTGSTALTVGTMVKVTGTTGIVDVYDSDELFITPAETGGVTALPGGTVLSPLVVDGRALRLPPVGLSATGLLVKVAGRVTALDTVGHLITIDDGTGVTYRAWYGDGFAVTGLVDKNVACTGCAGRLGGLPVIWMLSPTDLQISGP